MGLCIHNHACALLLKHEIPHILIDVDFTNKKTAPDFIAKYPHEEVPVLVDGEITVFDG